MFSTYLNNFLLFSSNLKLLSADCFNLDQSKICRLVMGCVLFTRHGSDIDLWHDGKNVKKEMHHNYHINVITCFKTWAHLILLYSKNSVHFFFCVLSQFDMLELDRLEKVLLPCPLLLDPDSYLPDTEDLTQDQPAREYWLDCFVDSIDKVCFKQFV